MVSPVESLCILKHLTSPVVVSWIPTPRQRESSLHIREHWIWFSLLPRSTLVKLNPTFSVWWYFSFWIANSASIILGTVTTRRNKTTKYFLNISSILPWKSVPYEEKIFREKWPSAFWNAKNDKGSFIVWLKEEETGKHSYNLHDKSLPSATKLREGNIFRSVGQEFCPRGMSASVHAGIHTPLASVCWDTPSA